MKKYHLSKKHYSLINKAPFILLRDNIEKGECRNVRMIHMGLFAIIPKIFVKKWGKDHPMTEKIKEENIYFDRIFNNRKWLH